MRKTPSASAWLKANDPNRRKQARKRVKAAVKAERQANDNPVLTERYRSAMLHTRRGL